MDMIESLTANDSDDNTSGAHSAIGQQIEQEEPDSGDDNADDTDDTKKRSKKEIKSDIDKIGKLSVKKESRLGDLSSSKKKPQFTPKQRMDMYAFCVLELELQNQRILNRRQQMAYRGPAPHTQMDTIASMPMATLDQSNNAAGGPTNQKRIIIHPPQQQTVVVVHGPPPQSPEQLQQLLQQPQMQQILQPPLYHTQAHFQLQFAQPPLAGTTPMLKALNQVQAPEDKSNKQRQTRRTKQDQLAQPLPQSHPPATTISAATTTTISSIQSGSSMDNQNGPNAQGTLSVDYNQQPAQTRFIINQGSFETADSQINTQNHIMGTSFQQTHILPSHQPKEFPDQIRVSTSQSNAVNTVQQIDSADLSGPIHRIPKKHECFSDYQNTQILSNHILKEVQKRFAYFYPNSPTPSRTTIKHVWDNCITSGTVQNKKKERKKTNQPMAEVIEYLLVHEPQLSLRQLAKKLNVSTGTVSKRCKELGLVPESVTLKHHQMALAKRQKQLKQIEMITKAYEEENVDTNHRVVDNSLKMNGNGIESVQINSNVI